MSGFPEIGHVLPPFSRPLEVDDLSPEGLELTISATEAERRALAAEDGLAGLAKLEGSLQITPFRGGGVLVNGEMRARITQICVVTLEPFDTEIIERIEVKFAPGMAPEFETSANSRAVKQRRRETRPSAYNNGLAPSMIQLAGEDPPDPIIGGRIDLGALIAEFLALGLDPHPRRPGVQFEEGSTSRQSTPGEGPFAKLKGLRDMLPS